MGARQTNTPCWPLATLAARRLPRVPSTQIACSAAGSRWPRGAAVGPGSRPAELGVVAAAPAAKAAAEAAAAAAAMAAMAATAASAAVAAAVAAGEAVLAVMAAAAAAVAVSLMAVLVAAAAVVGVVAAVALEEDRGLFLAQSTALSMSQQRWQQLLLRLLLLLLLLLAVLSITVGPPAPSASEDTRDHVRQVFKRLGWDVKAEPEPVEPPTACADRGGV
jgi:hypothetical protein